VKREVWECIVPFREGGLLAPVGMMMVYVKSVVIRVGCRSRGEAGCTVVRCQEADGADILGILLSGSLALIAHYDDCRTSADFGADETQPVFSLGCFNLSASLVFSQDAVAFRRGMEMTNRVW
jgi:hypothetical protein